MRFARLHADTSLFRDIVEMTQQNYDDLLVSNPAKAALLRPLVTDPLPTFDPVTHKVEPGPIVIEATQARETWVVVAKTPEETEADELAAELAQMEARLTNLNEAIDEHQAVLAIPYSEPAIAANNTQEIAALRVRMRNAEQAIRDVERDLILTMRSAKWLLREARRRLDTRLAVVQRAPRLTNFKI